MTTDKLYEIDTEDFSLVDTIEDESLALEEDHEDLSSKFAGLRYSSEEYKAFRNIDRDAEDEMVMSFRKTKSTDTLVKLMKLREPTFSYMSRRYAYLDNEDDMYCEFKKIWLQCVKQYDGTARSRQERNHKTGELLLLENGDPKMIVRRTPFNTYLYTSMRNRIGNIIKHRHSKRLLDGNGTPVCDSMRSLDFQIGHDGDMTLQDVIPDNHAKQPSLVAEANEVKMLLGAGTDPDISQAIDRFYENSRITSLTEAVCLRIGTLRISKTDHKVLSIGVANEYGEEPSKALCRKAKDYLGRMIASSKTYNKFEVVSYSLNHNSVNFLVKIHNAALVRKVSAAIAKCKGMMNKSPMPEGMGRFKKRSVSVQYAGR